MAYSEETQEEFAQRQGGTDVLSRASGAIPAEDVDAALRRIEDGIRGHVGLMFPELLYFVAQERERLGLPKEVRV